MKHIGHDSDSVNGESSFDSLRSLIDFETENISLIDFMQTSNFTSLLGVISQIVEDKNNLSDELADIIAFVKALGSEDFGTHPRSSFNTSKSAVSLGNSTGTQWGFSISRLWGLLFWIF